MTIDELFELYPQDDVKPVVEDGPPASYLLGEDGVKRVDFIKKLETKYGHNYQTKPKALSSLSEYDNSQLNKLSDNVQTLSQLFGGP